MAGGDGIGKGRDHRESGIGQLVRTVDIQLVVAAHARARAGEFDGEIAGGGERYVAAGEHPRAAARGNDAVGSNSADCARPSKGAATINQNEDLGLRSVDHHLTIKDFIDPSRICAVAIQRKCAESILADGPTRRIADAGEIAVKRAAAAGQAQIDPSSNSKIYRSTAAKRIHIGFES